MEPKKMTIGGLLHQYVNNYAACCGNLTPEEMEAHGNNHRLMHNELLRRLNEADALRKENEELRKDKEKLLKDYAELRVNSALLVACDDALEALELDNTKESEIDALRKDKERIDFLDDGNYGIDPRNIPGVMMNGRRFHCLAGRGDWSSLRDAIDAARLAKESEASHE
jgi:hypothetical protein